SMIGKLIVHQATREEAIRCLSRALSELRIEGIRTTVPFHEKMLHDPVFLEGAMDTKYVERSMTATS
ncbi:MAG TPA: acetyl-CoA carboxylase biotin carboxylase subunit, partial [Pirellulaceae bacterium]